ncbi:mucin-5AC-like, partial [Python bivittatus]|uniref:Mucin-5AC-like n=1 Tax=Python bivittatus TaxID=176946 RepID=A0A9F3W1Z8_PYTBI
TAHTHVPPHSTSTQTTSGVTEATTVVFSPSALPGGTHSLGTTRTTEVSDGSIASASPTSSGVTPNPTSQSSSTVYAPASTTASTSALSRETSSLPSRHSSPAGATGTLGHVSSSTASASTASADAELSPTTPSPTHTAHPHAPPHSTSTQTTSGVSEATAGVFSPSALPGGTHSLRTTRTTEVSDGSIASASPTSSGVTPNPTSQSSSTVYAPASTTASTSALSRETSSLPTRHSSPAGATVTVGHVSSRTASASTASAEGELSPTTPSPTQTAHTHAPPHSTYTQTTSGVSEATTGVFSPSALPGERRA